MEILLAYYSGGWGNGTLVFGFLFLVLFLLAGLMAIQIGKSREDWMGYEYDFFVYT